MKNKFLLAITALSLGFVSCNSKPDPNDLTKEQAKVLETQTFTELTTPYVNSLQASWDAGVLQSGEYKMPFWYEVNGEKPEDGYPMYISMHGGGGAPAAVNDQQWENQKRLYGTVDGIYWVPRAPTDTWNLWHQEYMDDFLLQAVTYAVQKLGADPERIYLMGYSAGGDGTFNLAPRLADRFAAAAMMAGHPGDAVAENLRNLPFAIYMGGKDAAYNRNGLAAQWGEKLAALQAGDKEGYENRVVIYPEKGHWMDNEDKEALPWMSKFERDNDPEKIIWIQDDVLATRKYNLEVANPAQGNTLIVTMDDDTNTINIEKSDYANVSIYLNDDMMDLDKDVTVTSGGKTLFKGKVNRTAENIKKSIEGRYDPEYVFSARIDVGL